MKAIRIYEAGGPEVLRYEEVATPTPGKGEVLVKVAIAGVNFADLLISLGRGRSPHPIQFPLTPGCEVVGMVAALGEGVTGLSEGERVAATLGNGGYAEYAVVDAKAVVKIPDEVTFEQATALLIQGLTGYGAVHDGARIQPGESVLVQAAGGGIGTLAVQFAKLAGAGLIVGTASSEKKRETVRRLGAEHVIDYTQERWVEQVYAATGGRGVDVVMDAVGGTLGAQALGCLAPLGRLVFFGSASGESLQTFDLMQMTFKGLTVSAYGHPWLRPGRAQAAREAILGYLVAGQLEVVVGQSFPLAEAGRGLRAMMERQAVGKVLLYA